MTPRFARIGAFAAALLSVTVGIAAAVLIYSWPAFQACIITRRGAFGVNPGPRWMETICTPDSGTLLTGAVAGVVVATTVLLVLNAARSIASEQRPGRITTIASQAFIYATIAVLATSIVFAILVNLGGTLGGPLLPLVEGALR